MLYKMAHSNKNELVNILNFPCHEAGIRVEHGLPVMMEIDRLIEIKDEQEQRIRLFELLSGDETEE